jgi:3-hydroxybutyryl-CoA dehydrogenase
MTILVIGDQIHVDECKAKFGEQHEYIFEMAHSDVDMPLSEYDVIFDFILDEDPLQAELYANDKSATVFINTVKLSLVELSNMFDHDIEATLFGFSGLPTLINREVMEVSVRNATDDTSLQQICKALNTNYLLVEDRIGLVTPRIICMIINEAYFTVQEGTATREDIDKAMKLGTNYPYGPFEWCEQIGIYNVYEVLEAVYNDTRDERYKVCPLLKREYLQA